MNATTYGPPELRIQWELDPEPYDPGEDDDGSYGRITNASAYTELYGVYGCVLETRKPSCGCCGAKAWEHAASLWSIVGDEDYRREIERELMAEVLA